MPSTLISTPPRVGLDRCFSPGDAQCATTRRPQEHMARTRDLITWVCRSTPPRLRPRLLRLGETQSAGARARAPWAALVRHPGARPPGHARGALL